MSEVDFEPSFSSTSSAESGVVRDGAFWDGSRCKVVRVGLFGDDDRSKEIIVVIIDVCEGKFVLDFIR